MSPEINGNPPSVTKRKKNRDKKPPQHNPIDFNLSNNYFSSNPNSFQNVSIPDLTHYYSFLNYSNVNEPTSLPVYPMNYPNYYPNYMSTPKLLVPPSNGDATEYLSLPVGVNDTTDDDIKRRFSDPGLPNDSDEDSSQSHDSRIVQKLAQQVSFLNESNRKLRTQLMEMRLELNMLKQQQNGRHYEREYEPGMLADIIREVRDAARVREDALLARVKHMIEEKQLTMSHLQLVNEKNRNNDRITKLEEQLKSLSMNSSRSEENLVQQTSAGVGLSVGGGGGGIVVGIEESNTNIAARQVMELEREKLELRRELQDARAKKEEADQKLLQLDKKLASIMRRNDICTSDMSEDGKTNSIDTLSVTTTTSSISHIPPPTPRVTLSGPVTDL